MISVYSNKSLFGNSIELEFVTIRLVKSTELQYDYSVDTLSNGPSRKKTLVMGILNLTPNSFSDGGFYFGLSRGMKRAQFILDPGIGFGKTLEHNLEIIKRLHEFKKLDLPLLIGVSRKGHLGKLLQQRLGLPQMPTATERLEASLAETAVAVLNGASIVRTHDVLQTVKFLAVLDALKNDE